jgi:phosphonate transport system substrate-binding protein
MTNLLNLLGKLFFVVVLSAPMVSSVNAEHDGNHVYTVGVVPQFDARRIHAIWRPILDALEEKTGLRFSLRGSPTIPAFEKGFIQGSFDFAYMNPYHILPANQKQGYMPLVRDAERTLYGVLVVARDSPIQQVSDLDGKTVAFPAPNALGASLMIRADFQNIFKIQVLPRYVKSHSSVYLNVVLGETAAGGGVQKTLGQQPENIREALRVLYTTDHVAPHPFTVHPRVPDAVRKKVRVALLSLAKTEAGKDMLARIPIKRIGIASMDDYRPLADLGLERFYEE